MCVCVWRREREKEGGKGGWALVPPANGAARAVQGDGCVCVSICLCILCVCVCCVCLSVEGRFVCVCGNSVLWCLAWGGGGRERVCMYGVACVCV